MSRSVERSDTTGCHTTNQGIPEGCKSAALSLPHLGETLLSLAQTRDRLKKQGIVLQEGLEEAAFKPAHYQATRSVAKRCLFTLFFRRSLSPTQTLPC